MFLTFPNNGVSLVYYITEQIPNWKLLDSIFISSLDKTDLIPAFEQNNNVWISQETSNEDCDKCLPPLSCALKQIRFDMWAVEWIEYDGWRKHFSSNPIGKSVFILNGNVA